MVELNTVLMYKVCIVSCSKNLSQLQSKIKDGLAGSSVDPKVQVWCFLSEFFGGASVTISVLEDCR